MSNTPDLPPFPVVAVLHRDEDGTFFLKYEGDEQIYDVAMRNSPLSKALDAYAQAYAAPLLAQLEAARAALRLSQEKLNFYFEANGGEYLGGIEFSALMLLIDTALSTAEQPKDTK